MANIFEFKQKNKSKKEDDSSYELSLAKQIIESDKQLCNNIQKLGIDQAQAAKWIVWLSDMIREIDDIVLKYTDKAEDDKKFSILAVKALTSSLVSQISFIGSLQDIDLQQFESMKEDIIAQIFFATYAGMDIQDYINKIETEVFTSSKKGDDND